MGYITFCGNILRTDPPYVHRRIASLPLYCVNQSSAFNDTYPQTTVEPMGRSQAVV